MSTKRKLKPAGKPARSAVLLRGCPFCHNPDANFVHESIDQVSIRCPCGAEISAKPAELRRLFREAAERYLGKLWNTRWH
jgi:hypothetical protein